MPTPRTILITGVGRGLGADLAERFIERGDRVWGTVRAGRWGRAEALLHPGGLTGLVEMDLADEDSIVRALESVVVNIEALDVLINCAGLDARAVGAAPERRGPFDLSADAFTALLRVNAVGPMVVTRELLPLLRTAADPLVVNISSQLGSMQVAASIGLDTAYCVSKAALNMWSVRAAAALRGDGIGVVMLHPGWVQTDMGGPSAQLTAFESSTAVAATIDALTPADSGRFVRWDGTDHPW